MIFFNNTCLKKYSKSLLFCIIIICAFLTYNYYYATQSIVFTEIIGRPIYSVCYRNIENLKALDDVITTTETEIICNEAEKFIEKMGYDKFINQYKSNAPQTISSFEVVTSNYNTSEETLIKIILNKFLDSKLENCRREINILKKIKYGYLITVNWGFLKENMTQEQLNNEPYGHDFEALISLETKTILWRKCK